MFLNKCVRLGEWGSSQACQGGNQSFICWATTEADSPPTLWFFPPQASTLIANWSSSKLGKATVLRTVKCSFETSPSLLGRGNWYWRGQSYCLFRKDSDICVCLLDCSTDRKRRLQRVVCSWVYSITIVIMGGGNDYPTSGTCSFHGLNWQFSLMYLQAYFSFGWMVEFANSMCFNFGSQVWK